MKQWWSCMWPSAFEVNNDGRPCLIDLNRCDGVTVVWRQCIRMNSWWMQSSGNTYSWLLVKSKRPVFHDIIPHPKCPEKKSEVSSAIEINKQETFYIYYIFNIPFTPHLVWGFNVCVCECVFKVRMCVIQRCEAIVKLFLSFSLSPSVDLSVTHNSYSNVLCLCMHKYI